MPKRIIAFVASLAVIIGLMNCGSSYAWFASTSKKKQSISILAVSSTQSAYITDLQSNNKTVIVQGDNLINLNGNGAELEIENKSTANTQVRISIEYTSCANGSPEQVTYKAEDDDDIEVVFADNAWAKNVNAGGTCYFYYVGDNYITDSIVNVDGIPSVPASVNYIKAISSIAYKDSVSYAYSGVDINVKVKFETKQADNVSWQTLDSYEVSGTAND